MTTQLRLKDKPAEKIKKIAELNHRSFNGQIEFIIDMYIKDYEKVNGEII